MGIAFHLRLPQQISDQTSWSGPTYVIEHCSLVGAVEEAFKHKTCKYAELAADAEQHRWKAEVCPVEDSSRDSFGQSFGYLTTWEFEATRNVKLSKSCQTQQKK